jgi:hypothetical protein
MVLVRLRALREFYTKIARPPTLFPPPQPRARKIKPKNVRTLHERSSKRSKFTFTASEPIIQPLGNLQRIIIGLASRRTIGGYPPDPSAALTRRYWSPIFCPTGPWPSSLLIACPVPLIARREAKPFTLRPRGPGGSVLRVQVGLAYILKRRLCASHLRLFAELKPFHLFGGHHLGSVDCWLCQIFTRSLGTILPSIRVLRVTRRGFSPPESYMQRKC